MATAKQEQKQQSVSKQQSLLLVKNMIRLSISSICFVREIFPSNLFESKTYGNSSFHQIVAASKNKNTDQVEINNKDAFVLTQWLEQGVFDALTNEYLKAIRFYILTKHPVSGEQIPIESYEFKMTYEDDGHSVRLNGTKMSSRDDLKTQASKFVRSLVEFTGTLDTLPDDRILTMTISYTDNAPENYEPAYFRSAQGKEFMFLGKPMKVKLGVLTTPHQEMTMRFTGFESLLDEDLRALAPDQAAMSGDGRDKSPFQGFNHSISRDATGSAISVRAARVISSEADPDSVRSGTTGASLKASTVAAVAPAAGASTPAPLAPSTHEEVRRLFLSQSQSQSQDKTAADMLAMGNLKLSAPPSDLPPLTTAPKQTSLAVVRDFMMKEGKSTAANCAKNLGLSTAVVQSALDYMVNDGLISCYRRTYSLVTGSQSAPSYPSTQRGKSVDAPPSQSQSSRWPITSTAPTATFDESAMHTPLQAAPVLTPGVHLTQAADSFTQGIGTAEVQSQYASSKRDRVVEMQEPEPACDINALCPQLSQDSLVSVASESNDSAGRASGRKRARPDSVIRDPLHVATPQLLALHSTSRTSVGGASLRVGSAGGHRGAQTHPRTSASRLRLQ